MTRPTAKSRMIAVFGLIMTIVFGYFATVRGLTGAVRDWPLVFGLIGMVAVGVSISFNKVDSNNSPYESSRISSEELERIKLIKRIGSILSWIGLIIFFIESNLSSYTLRIAWGIVALILFITSCAFEGWGSMRYNSAEGPKA